MSWREVARRDVRSVYRSRTGPAVAALVALFTVVPVGLMALAADIEMVAAVGGVLTVGALLALVFFGTPRSIAAFVVVFTGLAVLWTAAIANPQNPPDMGLAVIGVGGGLSLVIPIVAMLASYAAIVGERTTGSVRFLFGLPNSRQGVSPPSISAAPASSVSRSSSASSWRPSSWAPPSRTGRFSKEAPTMTAARRRPATSGTQTMPARLRYLAA